MMQSHDSKFDRPIAQFLRDRKVADHVRQSTWPQLLDHWQQIVIELEKRQPILKEEFQNDMDFRQLLADVLEHLPELAQAQKPALTRLDDRARATLLPSADCIYSPKFAKKNRWSPARNWWYFHRPQHLE